MTCLHCGQQTDRAQSSAPLVSLLRILERCYRERQHALPADLVERIREQLEGPIGYRARADVEVLEAMAAVHPRALKTPRSYGDDFADACEAELARRVIVGGG